MAVVQNRLKDLVFEYRKSGFAGKMFIRSQVKAYMDMRKVEDLVREVDEIEDYKDVKILIGCAPRGRIYLYLMHRLLLLESGFE